MIINHSKNKIRLMRQGIGLFLLLFYGCSGLERSEQEKIRRVNAKAEVILREEGETHVNIPPPERYIRGPYSWEKEASSRQ